MNDITNHKNDLSSVPQSKELRALCRTEEDLSVGDHFFKGQDLIRVSEIIHTENSNHTLVKYDLVTDLVTGEGYKNYGSLEINTFIKEVGGKYVPDPQGLYKQAEDFLNGTYTPELPQEEEWSEEGNSTALVNLHSHKDLVTLAQQKELLIRQMSDLEQMAQHYRMAIQYRLQNKIREFNKTCSVFRKQLNNIQKVLSMLQLYMGDEHCVTQLSTGENAVAEVPLSIHQQLLFMDEECGIITDGGIDIERIEEFDKWLMQDNHLEIILPEKKGIVALKPRRFRKEYGDRYYTSLMNQWNRHTFFIIRNGENVYRIDSDHIEISERLFPLRAEMQSLYDRAMQANEFQKESCKDEIQSANERYCRIILFLQGLMDHTEVFNPVPDGVNLFKPESYAGWVNMVYDDEPSLTDGRLSYAEWLIRINDGIKRGSRIVYCAPDRYDIGWHKGDLRSFANRHLMRFYENEFAIPDLPVSGIYTVDDVKYENQAFLGFKYMPEDNGFGYYSDARKNRLTFRLRHEDKVINYDRISLEDIEFYLNSRLERKHYLNVLPVLLEVRKSLLREQKQEDAFRWMMIGELRKSGMTEETASRHIDEAIDWWKYKNIWKRPISDDDAKALRMIRKRVLRLVGE